MGCFWSRCLSQQKKENQSTPKLARWLFLDGEITKWPIFSLTLQEIFFSFYNGYSSFNDLKINASFPISGKIKIAFTYGDWTETGTSMVCWIRFLGFVHPSSTPTTAELLTSLSQEAAGQTIDSSVWASVLLSPVLLPVFSFFPILVNDTTQLPKPECWGCF